MAGSGLVSLGPFLPLCSDDVRGAAISTYLFWLQSLPETPSIRPVDSEGVHTLARLARAKRSVPDL
jgi:hypothetical protein